jgi:hypothetical protein
MVQVTIARQTILLLQNQRLLLGYGFHSLRGTSAIECLRRIWFSTLEVHPSFWMISGQVLEARPGVLVPLCRFCPTD